MSKRPIRRPKTSWEDDVLENMNVNNLKKIAQNRDSWKKVDEQARSLYRLYRFVRRWSQRLTLSSTRLEHTNHIHMPVL